MEGEAGILQDRVEPAAVERRRVEPEERVGGEQHEGQEADADQRLHAQHAGPERRRQVAAEHAPRRRRTATRIHTQSTSEPSWLPQVPLIL